mgnify:CR=1 FL=1
MSDKPLFRQAAAMIIAVFLLVVLLTPATAAFPGSNGKILFQGAPQSPLNYDIFVMDNNGFNEVNLTNSSAVNDFDAAWSPDGTKIAFTTNRDGNNEIYIMNADGTSPVNISNNAASDTTPAWSPNGLKLLFISNRDGNNEVFVMNADGTGVSQITSTTGTVTHKNPTWKPDASRIAYTSNKDTVPADGRFDEIYLANPDGTNEVRLTVTPNGVTNPYYSRLPGWSPDGSKIVFFSRRTATGKDVIYTLLDNGTVEPSQTPVALSDFPSRASSHARYSPDGTRIVFNSCRIAGGGSDWNSCGDGNHEIFVMNADGSNPTRMTHALSRLDVSPDWQVVAPTVIGATCTTDCYVAPNGSDANDGASAATPLKSIQLALDTVWNNGTVHFAAGDYFENSPYGWVELTLLNKSVTLLGAGSGQSIIRLPNNKTNGLMIDGSNLDIVIEGLTFTHRAAGTNAAGFNIRIGETNAVGADVTFTDVESAYATARNASMEAPGTYGTVLLDRVNMHHSVQWGMGIDSTVSNLTVTDSHFDDNGRDYSPLGTGLYLAAGLKQNVLIEDSTFNRNTAFNNPASGAGLWLDSVEGVTIQNIEATGNNYGVNIAASLADSSDILMENSAITGNLVYGVVISADQNRTLDGVMVRYNDLTGNAHNGVVVNRAGNGVFADTHVNRNDLSGNPTGMSFFNAAANEEADGQCNWWGAADGPSAFAPGSGVWVGDNIDFTPWLLSTNLHDPTCFIGNTITVKKVAAGGGTTEFEFNPSWSATNFVLKDGESTTVDQLVPGAYSVSEVTPLPTGWSLQSATCDNTATTPVETADPANITVADGDAWLCTFTNTYDPTGSITVTKETNPDGGAGFTFTLEPDTHPFLTKWGSYGINNGEFNYPYGIAVDGSGNVYVADHYNHRIQKFDAGGAYQGQWGGLGSGNGQFGYPIDVAVDGSGNVYVADKNKNRIQKLDNNGNYQSKWGSYGSNNGEFNGIYGLAMDGVGNVYVTDTNSLIQKFDAGGVFLTQWGGYGSGDGQFAYPYGVAADESGYIYVADTYNHRIQKFGLSSVMLDDDQSHTFRGLSAGTYTLSETDLPADWSLDSATCDNTATQTVETVDPSSITLAVGDEWVCTFTNIYTPPPTNICNVQDSSALWTDIIGKGMGNTKKHKNQVKLTIPNYAQVDSLYGQMVAKNTGNANYVRFILPGKNNWVQVNTITSPADMPGGNFWYGDYIDPAKLPTKTVTGRWFLQKNGAKNHIPRALVLYPTYESATNTYVNIWNTYDAAEGEVYWDTANGWTQERVIVESIAPPNDFTTFNVELALVDNDKDARPIWVTVEAGGVTQTQMPNNPSDADQLNLMTFTLANVPAGTDEITITIYSPSMAADGVIGDSAALVGMRANYMCAPLN